MDVGSRCLGYERNFTLRASLRSWIRLETFASNLTIVFLRICPVMRGRGEGPIPIELIFFANVGCCHVLFRAGASSHFLVDRSRQEEEGGEEEGEKI